MAKEKERLRALAPEVRDMVIDGARRLGSHGVGHSRSRWQGSNRSKGFSVLFYNGKSKEYQYEGIYLHLRNETEN